ncbi:MAG: glycosyltransferase family 2 protein [Prosthecobacter sp.]|jgi:glycosyltransferase involved in cell wall biosynthesis
MPALISICLTTYNRSAGLRHAVESVLSQDYPRFELIICDNASSDDTTSVARDLCAKDERVRYLRHPENMGSIANFMSGLPHCRGEYFMWLADDDWLGEGYLSTCAGFLDQHPDHVGAYGRVRYYKQGVYSHEGRVITLDQDAPEHRLLSYYQAVGDNGIYYSLMRLEQVKKVPQRVVMGTDWFFVAGMAWQGKIRALDDTIIHRDYNWNATSFDRIARSQGIEGFAARSPYLAIALEAFEDIRKQPLYASLPEGGRTRLALKAFWTLCRSKKAGMLTSLRALASLLFQHRTRLFAE